MTEILSQDDIDQLLSAVSDLTSRSKFRSVKEFEKYLIKRKFKTEKPYGIFDHDISICKYFNSDNSDSLLQDIKVKNENTGIGNIKIPNTNIMLINYSFCPKCKTIFSFKEVVEYYENPIYEIRYINRANQYRQDTRVYCKNCNTYFLPSLIISDGTPKNEVQFLCRVQTIEAVEQFFDSKNVKVLTKKQRNIIHNGKLKAIKNDVYIKDLEEKPTLITNILQYTPFKIIINLIDGTNVEKGDLLFNEWK